MLQVNRSWTLTFKPENIISIWSFFSLIESLWQSWRDSPEEHTHHKNHVTEVLQKRLNEQNCEVTVKAKI